MAMIEGETVTLLLHQKKDGTVTFQRMLRVQTKGGDSYLRPIPGPDFFLSGLGAIPNLKLEFVDESATRRGSNATDISLTRGSSNSLGGRAATL